MVKICIECKHYKIEPRNRDRWSFCTHISAIKEEIDKSTGEITEIYNFAKIQRQNRLGYCGQDGRFFEPLDKQNKRE